MKKAESIRWTQEGAAAEFGLNPRTVAARIKTAGVAPGPDGKFSTADVHRAICGDYEKQRARKMKEDADQVALANAKERGELVDKRDFVGRLEKFVVSARQEVLASARSDADKDALLNVLAGLLQSATE